MADTHRYSPTETSFFVVQFAEICCMLFDLHIPYSDACGEVVEPCRNASPSLNSVVITTIKLKLSPTGNRLFASDLGIAKYSWVHHTTDKVFDLTCDLNRELDLRRYGDGRVAPMRGDTPLVLFNTKTKVLASNFAESF